ncbi:hypothetical protein LTR56_014675 [Elasticomyces elasticus]|nr:hypothetical protein LTR56_014675 [Elasticomyces elasticus]KAK3636794.1 hypothetical protein LTR22_018547 [Elasticomyces elasticus]KAK4912498.1 hypothetical protein LTR49_019042 [Elasticomyces elasticus]KAK5751864.1 hypothetical protein LTS12_018042 [Elasticomyces elasticus]
MRKEKRASDVGKLPALGWNSWNAYSGDLNASIVESTARIFISLGLKDAGYEYVNMDDYWATSSRASDGQLQADPTILPDGMEGVANRIHALGLKAGIYSSASVETCGGYPASLDHEQTDAATFANWGIDYLKYDNCQNPAEHPGVEAVDEYDYCTLENGADEFNDQPVINGSCAITNMTAPGGYNWSQSNTYHRYQAMSNAIMAQEHEILFSLCDWGWADVRSWGASLGSSWCVVGDIQADWDTIMGTFNQAIFMASLVDFWGHNDLEILEVGNGGIYPEECRTHFAMWAAMKSPLLIGTDLASLSDDRVAILKNQYLLAFNQDDTCGKPAVPFNWDWSWNRTHPSARYWSGQSSADVLVLMFNPNDDTESMTANWSDVPELGAAGGSYQVTDIWTSETSCVAEGFTSSVIRHDTAGALVGEKC